MENNRCKCPSALNSSIPCSLALSKIHALQVASAEGKNVLPLIDSDDDGCPWYVNSADHNYCFWHLVKELQGDFMSDKDICNLLGITPDQLKETYSSAIQKLIQSKDDPVIAEFIELLWESSQESGGDNTIYIPDNFRNKIEEEMSGEKANDDVEKVKKGPGRPKIDRPVFKGPQPTHRDQRKKDLYGLYSRGALLKREEKKAEEKKKKNEKKRNKNK